MSPKSNQTFSMGEGGVLTLSKFRFFCLECFPKLTTGLSDEEGGQGQLNTQNQGLRRREKLVEGGRWGAEG